MSSFRQIENAGAIERCKKLEDSIARDDWQAKAKVRAFEHHLLGVPVCMYV